MVSAAIALFHPGEMGSAVGACTRASGHRVICALAGRSAASQARAKAAGLENAGSIAAAVAESDLVLSICPPHGALPLAHEVASLGFKGIYVDANAVSPHTARKVGEVVEAAGASFVDGGLFGAPPSPGRPVNLRLSGERAGDVAKLFEGSCVRASALEGPPGTASALKACFAAWTKGTWLLLASLYAAAEREHVAAPLRQLWSETHPDLLDRLKAPSNNPGKAWRWLSEMEEIAATFESAGQPKEFFVAAAEICRRLEQFKDDPSRPSIERILPALSNEPETQGHGGMERTP